MQPVCQSLPVVACITFPVSTTFTTCHSWSEWSTLYVATWPGKLASSRLCVYVALMAYRSTRSMAISLSVRLTYCHYPTSIRMRGSAYRCRSTKIWPMRKMFASRLRSFIRRAKVSTLEANNVESLQTRNVSLWQVRGAFESTRCVCRSQARLRMSSSPQISNALWVCWPKWVRWFTCHFLMMFSRLIRLSSLVILQQLWIDPCTRTSVTLVTHLSTSVWMFCLRTRPFKARPPQDFTHPPI